MSNNIEAQGIVIGSLLGQYERRPVVLPEFQRPYSWEKSQISTFWTDLAAFQSDFQSSPLNASYFLGPIVTLKDDAEIPLLDGQQRLATIIILLSAIRDAARKLDSGTTHKGADFARDIQREVILKDESTNSYSLRLSAMDAPFFLQRIQKDPPESAEAVLRSHKLIDDAHTFFEERLTAALAGKDSTSALQVLKTLKDSVVKGVSLVQIIVDKEEEAYNIFETLNDRGLRLSVPDLVANLLLKRCAGDAARKTVREQWNALLQQMGKRDVSRFLRHYWISRFGDVKSRGLYSEIKDHLAAKKIDSLTFASGCTEECEHYVKLIELGVPASKWVLRDLEAMVKHHGALSAMPLLLSGYRCLNPSDFEKLLKRTVALYVRYSLITNQDPARLETVFFNAAREIRSKHDSKVVSAKCLSAAKTILSKLNPTDRLVEEKGKDLIVPEGAARWFMTELANAMQSKTKEIGMDKSNVEHIFPQNAGAEWPNRAQLEPLLWHVGNLTILGKRINTKAQNKAFKEKCKNHYSQSEIKMTTDLLKQADWTPEAVRQRAAHLAKEMVRLWQ